VYTDIVIDRLHEGYRMVVEDNVSVLDVLQKHISDAGDIISPKIIAAALMACGVEASNPGVEAQVPRMPPRITGRRLQCD
jgi:hypothetical protein